MLAILLICGPNLSWMASKRANSTEALGVIQDSEHHWRGAATRFEGLKLKTLQ